MVKNGRTKRIGLLESDVKSLGGEMREIKGELKTIKWLLGAALPAIYLGLLRTLVG